MKNKICKICYRRTQVEDNIIMVICPGCNEEMVDESITIKSKNGDSLYFLIPANMKNILGLEAMDIVEADLSVIAKSSKPEEEKEVLFSCNLCNYSFVALDNEDLYCPFCNQENRESFTIQEEIIK